MKCTFYVYFSRKNMIIIVCFQHVYFSDVGVGAIYRCKIDGSGLIEILNKSHGVGQVEG